MQTSRSQLSHEAMRFEPGIQSHCVRFDDDVDLQEFEPQRWVSRKTRTVAMWNLDHAYTEETLRADLWQVDFEPEEIIKYDIVLHVWKIVMPEPYMAIAMETVLNEIDPEEKVLKPSQDDQGMPMPVRVAQWGELGIPRALGIPRSPKRKGTGPWEDMSEA